MWLSCILRNRTSMVLWPLPKITEETVKFLFFGTVCSEVLTSGALPGHVCEHNLWTCCDATLSLFWSHGSGMRRRLPPGSWQFLALVLFQNTEGQKFPKLGLNKTGLNKTAHCVARWHKHILSFSLHCFWASHLDNSRLVQLKSKNSSLR